MVRNISNNVVTLQSSKGALSRPLLNSIFYLFRGLEKFRSRLIMILIFKINYFILFSSIYYLKNTCVFLTKIIYIYINK